MSADRRLINQALSQTLNLGRKVPTRLRQAMRYAVLGPGKRIRPLLLLWAYRAAGGRTLQPVLPFCCGIEFIHAFSLVHDDLPAMDNDDFRRGRPSLHRRFGESTAILAADGLFALAFELFARSPATAERRLAAITTIAAAVGPAGMTAGQFTDTTAGTQISGQRLLRMQEQKTAELLAAALVAGAILGGADQRCQRKLRQAGLHLGRLFQITDDLLDAEQASDSRVATMVSHYGRKKTRHLARLEATKATTIFDQLGASYKLLAGIPELILNRKA